MNDPIHMLFLHEPSSRPRDSMAAAAVVSVREDRCDPTDLWAVESEASLLAPDFGDSFPFGVRRLIVRAATPEAPRDESADLDSLCERAARSLSAWGARGHSLVVGACERIGPIARRAGITVCVRPGASGVISDIPSCMAFARRWSDGPFAIVLDPLDLITPDMAPRAAEHAERIAQALIEPRLVAAVFVRDDARSGDTPIALEIMTELARCAARASVPIIVPASEALLWSARLAPA